MFDFSSLNISLVGNSKMHAKLVELQMANVFLFLFLIFPSRVIW